MDGTKTGKGKKKRPWLQFSLSTAVVGMLIVAVVMWIFVRPSVKKVEYVLPISFHGLFKMVVDPDGGQEIIPINQVVTITVPMSGIVVVKTNEFLNDWHEESASFADGSPIPVSHENNTVGIAYYSLFSRTSNGHSADWFLIGTAKERDIAWGLHSELEGQVGKPPGIKY